MNPNTKSTSLVESTRIAISNEYKIKACFIYLMLAFCVIWQPSEDFLFQGQLLLFILLIEGKFGYMCQRVSDQLSQLVEAFRGHCG